MPTKLPSNNTYEKLKALMEAEEHTELECSKFLQCATELLTRDTIIETVYVDTQLRSSAGDADWVISARVKDDLGQTSVRAYVWELKAPQCRLFEKDTNSRCRPSKALIQAENQLLHYFYALKNDATKREDFQVVHPDDVCLGGIIIGRDQQWVKGLSNNQKMQTNHRRAHKIRRLYIYDPLRIQLKTWDRILEHIRKLEKLAPTEFHEIEEPLTIKVEDAVQVIDIVTLVQPGASPSVVVGQAPVE